MNTANELRKQIDMLSAELSGPVSPEQRLLLSAARADLHNELREVEAAEERAQQPPPAAKRRRAMPQTHGA